MKLKFDLQKGKLYSEKRAYHNDPTGSYYCKKCKKYFMPEITGTKKHCGEIMKPAKNWYLIREYK